MKDRSNDSSHHERTLLPRSYIPLPTPVMAGMRNSSVGPPWRIDPTTHCTMSERCYHGATSRSHPHACVTLLWREFSMSIIATVDRRAVGIWTRLTHLNNLSQPDLWKLADNRTSDWPWYMLGGRSGVVGVWMGGMGAIYPTTAFIYVTHSWHYVDRYYKYIVA